MTQLGYVILAEGFEEIEAAAPVDVLRRAGLDVQTVGLTGKQVRGSHGIIITADKTFDEICDKIPDVLVLPGGMPGSANLGKHKGLKELTENTAKKGNLVAAICAAPALTLAAWGLLNGRKATCYPGCETGYEQVNWQSAPVVVDGNFITAQGPGVAIAFALGIVDVLLGKNKRDSLAEQLLYRKDTINT